MWLYKHFTSANRTFSVYIECGALRACPSAKTLLHELFILPDASIFFSLPRIKEALQEDTVFHFAAPASFSREAETATLSVSRVISALLFFVMALIFCLHVPGASSQQKAVPAVSSAAAVFTPGVSALFSPPDPSSPPSEGSISGKVTFEGSPAKYKQIDMSPEPNCAKLYTSPPMPEGVVTGANNSLQNVVVYVSSGAPDETSSGPVVTFKQRGCRYAPHVLALHVNQEIWVQNDDSVTHTVHPMARTNKEWNRSQPPGTPPFAIKYDKAEFIRVRCELHPWMRGIFAVMKNSHYAITDDNGSFSLPSLSPGKYTITAWHETYGEISKEVVITAGETSNLSFVFKAKPY